MPQMAPLLWLNLLILFIGIYIIFIIMNYYIFMPTEVSSKETIKSAKISEKLWKW